MSFRKKSSDFTLQFNKALVYQNNTQVAIGGYAVKQPIYQEAFNYSEIDQKNEVD